MSESLKQNKVNKFEDTCWPMRLPSQLNVVAVPHRLVDKLSRDDPITRETNKEILVSAFQREVSSRYSFYLANMHSNVSQ